jgi:hypothetical protein
MGWSCMGWPQVPATRLLLVPVREHVIIFIVKVSEATDGDCIFKYTCRQRAPPCQCVTC